MPTKPLTKFAMFAVIKGKFSSPAVKSLTSSRRKFTPSLNVWLPRAIDRSFTNCHCVTLRPCGKKKPAATSSPPGPSAVMLVSPTDRTAGKTLRAAC